MLEQIAAAFDRQDYQTATRLLKPLLQQSPNHPGVLFYAARLHEVSGESESAEAIYRKLLKETTNPKLAIQARQGLQRLQAANQESRQEAIAQAKADPTNTGSAFLVLEPINGATRPPAVRNFARIMKLDPYTAQLHLPSRGWRLYRVGSAAEIQVYGQELRQSGIPVFWMNLQAIAKIRVFRVHYFKTADPQPTVVCQNEADQLGALTFNWSEVTRRVEGRLPIFEDVVDLDARNRLKRKEQTQDYAQICDLHLPGRNCILRICDTTYHFQQGIPFQADQTQVKKLQVTNRINWNSLLGFLDHNLTEVPLWADFTPFAETALDPLDLVGGLNAHVGLLRKAESNWDPAFQLYSSLIFLHETAHSS
ncbi:tetratricopeptide repeat protein [Leptolyngbya sp. FACHB-671]|uniref:tetratricopeptide repeat protein n=1 Tax=Leptolyngbya sp. FACHB-671 TaxID=2692812 RepID=UPI0016836735|nr:tetratricopeptide repeat protein [Leptolyngbya sp. FACHB-671]MBD2070492.1 tetratricopeptide repeat protein [Leptolyngbya sp. FACHB-671]